MQILVLEGLKDRKGHLLAVILDNYILLLIHVVAINGSRNKGVWGGVFWLK